jgi:hypothetical protein
MVDLNQSLKWQLGNQTYGVAHCLCESSRPFCVKLERDLCGPEAMNLQGLNADDIVGEYSDKDLFSLSGAAFNGFVIDSIIMSIAACTPWDRLPVMIVTMICLALLLVTTCCCYCQGRDQARLDRIS